MTLDHREVPRLVLDLLRAAHEAAKDNTSPNWIPLTSLNLDRDPERTAAAVALATIQGWALLAGEARSIKITASGIELLKDRGLA